MGFIVFSGCEKNDEPIGAPEISSLVLVPKGFPEVEFPEDNQFTEARWLLGKKLFYDPVMSNDFSISCGTCHDPSLAFADNKRFSDGASNAPGVRNSPSLANVAYHPYYTREGGVPTLEMQVLVPIQEHNEFNSNILDVADRLKGDADYLKMAVDAYDREPDPFVITRAIATFERTLISGSSLYDEGILSLSAKRGMVLFFSPRTNCSSCHSGFNFTNYEFTNNGLYVSYDDVGRYRLTRDSTDLSVFKVPSLRNVALTAPYMHDGSISNLKQVVEHYNSGGFNHLNKSEIIRPLGLSEQEQNDIVEFLKTLSDIKFTSNELLHDN